LRIMLSSKIMVITANMICEVFPRFEFILPPVSGLEGRLPLP